MSRKWSRPTPVSSCTDLLELNTIDNEAIRLPAEPGDNGTRELFESILKDEEGHLDWIETQLDQIKQMGIQNYLTEQIG